MSEVSQIEREEEEKQARIEEDAAEGDDDDDGSSSSSVRAPSPLVTKPSEMSILFGTVD